MAEPRKVYAFSSVTGEFEGEETAFESPLEKGVFHLPANSTDTQPPNALPGMARVWRDDAWALVPDYRGCPVWSKATGRRASCGQLGPLPTDLTELAPPTVASTWREGAGWLPNIEAARSATISGITKQMQRQADALTAGYLPAEVASWPVQAAEAYALNRSLEADTPLLEALAEARGISIEALAVSVRANAESHAAALARIIADHRARVASAKAATTAAALDALLTQSAAA